jgi:hypothetical protein
MCPQCQNKPYTDKNFLNAEGPTTTKVGIEGLIYCILLKLMPWFDLFHSSSLQVPRVPFWHFYILTLPVSLQLFEGLIRNFIISPIFSSLIF